MTAPVTLSDRESDFLTAALAQADYPPALLAARRAAFVRCVREHDLYALDCDDIETGGVSDEQDERNSRPYPY